MTATGGPRGRFITFEGGEGAGKSTQCTRLAATLAEHGIAAIVTREPGGSPKGEAIRALLLEGSARHFGPGAEALLFSAARIDHLDRTIRPALAAGQWVICDRFADSTRAYQGALGKVEKRLIDALERVVVGTTRPDLTIILDLPPEEGLARAKRRAGQIGAADRFETETLEFHEAVRQAFLDIRAREPVRCALIDATAPPDEVAARIWSTVKLRLPDKSRLPHRARRPAGRSGVSASMLEE
jgi:dTMP kinase